MKRITTTLLLHAVFLAADARAETGPVVLWSQHQPAAGLRLAETTTIEMKSGQAQMIAGGLPLKGTATALLRDRLTRSFESADEQIVEFTECTRNIVFSLGGKPGDMKDHAGQLAGKKVRGTREAARAWKFVFAGAKPSSAEESALRQFSIFNIAIDSVASIYGAEPREIGKPWRPDFSAFSKLYPGIAVTIDCRLDEVADRDGDQHAKIAIGGLVTARFGGNDIEARFAGFIVRSLRDQIDTEVDLNGTLRLQRKPDKAKEEEKGPADAVEISLTAPLTLKRTVKVTGR